MIRKTLTGVAPFVLAMGFATPASAMGDICVLHEDATGDVGASLTQGQAGTDQFPGVDIEWIGVSDDGDGNYEFYIKVVDLSTVYPQTSWSMQFTGPDGNPYTARMLTDASGNASFIYFQSPHYLDDAEGWANSKISQNPASGEFTADGLIKIVVPSDGVGAAANSTVSGFVARVAFPQNPSLSPTPDNAPDAVGEPVGEYTIGGACVAKTMPVEESKFASDPRFAEKGCNVFTDPAGDAIGPQHDLTAVNLSSNGITMLAQWHFSDATLPSQETSFGVHYLDDNGNGRYFAFSNLTPGNGTTFTGARAHSGAWDPASDTYSIEGTYLNADGWQKDVSGNTFSLVVPLDQIGNPSVLTSVGSLVVSENTGFVYERTANDGTFDTASSSCGAKAGEETKSAATATASNAGAGSLGSLLLIAASLIGLRRRMR